MPSNEAGAYERSHPPHANTVTSDEPRQNAWAMAGFCETLANSHPDHYGKTLSSMYSAYAHPNANAMYVCPGTGHRQYLSRRGLPVCWSHRDGCPGCESAVRYVSPSRGSSDVQDPSTEEAGTYVEMLDRQLIEGDGASPLSLLAAYVPNERMLIELCDNFLDRFGGAFGDASA